MEEIAGHPDHLRCKASFREMHCRVLGRTYFGHPVGLLKVMRRKPGTGLKSCTMAVSQPGNEDRLAGGTPSAKFRVLDKRDQLAYTHVYAKPWEDQMQSTAKIFMNNRSQAVRIPKEFQFKTQEVFIRKQGDDVILSPRPKDWSGLLSPEAAASEEFMKNVEKLPVQERKF